MVSRCDALINFDGLISDASSNAFWMMDNEKGLYWLMLIVKFLLQLILIF